jgi:hypothetical protein
MEFEETPEGTKIKGLKEAMLKPFESDPYRDASGCEDLLLKRVKALEAALKGLLSRFPKEETDYSGVGRCAGCGALHWCAGNPGMPEPCKPNCVLQAAKKVMSGQTIESDTACHIENLGKRIKALEAKLETERMRLARCGVIAMANTPETAALFRIPKDSPDYSASMADVEAAVDREIALKERVQALEYENGNMDATYQDRMLDLEAKLHKHYAALRSENEELKAQLERR